MCEEAGVARTERSITNWCQPDRNGISRLDAYFDPNEHRYFITPQSVERAIAEEKSKVKSPPHAPETPQPFPNDSEAFRSFPNASEPRAPEQPATKQHDHANASPDVMKELEDLRAENFGLRVSNSAKDQVLKLMDEDRQKIFNSALENSRRIGELEQKLLQLGAPRQETLYSVVDKETEYEQDAPPTVYSGDTPS